MKIANDNITELKENEIFVFGSNLSGRHGKGAAKTALDWGAVYGKGNGIQGKTYGIPTKDVNVYKTLPLSEIKKYVNEFLNYAFLNPDKTFLVTEVGCGLAGYSVKEIAPLFKRALELDNILLPRRFYRKIKTDD